MIVGAWEEAFICAVVLVVKVNLFVRSYLPSLAWEKQGKHGVARSFPKVTAHYLIYFFPSSRLDSR